MKYDNNSKSQICNLLNNIKDDIHYIFNYYQSNFEKGMLIFIRSIKKNSIRELSENDIKEFIISELNNNLEDHCKLHSNLVTTVNLYNNKVNFLFKKIYDIPILYRKKARFIDNFKESFKFTYITDGDVGLENDFYAACIMHIYYNYKKLLKQINKALKIFTKEKVEKLNKDEAIFNELTFINDLTNLMYKLQSNITYYKSNNVNSNLENKRNRYIRDLLEVNGKKNNFKISDQSQRGESPKCKEPGEIDLIIEYNDKPFTYIEALNMEDDFNKKYLQEHIKKLTTNYDKVGNSFNVILVYADSKDFNNFKEKYRNFINSNFETYEEMITDKSNSFIYETYLDRQKIYHLVFKIG